MSDDYEDWQAGLSRSSAAILADWSLTRDGEPWVGTVARVWPVRTADGTPAALKLGYPHAEAAYEHLALRAWAGAGAVRLLRADPRRWALLLERAEPGHNLDVLPVLDACEVIAGLYQQLHRAALPQLDRLSDHARRWAGELEPLLESRQVPRRFVQQAISLATDLAADPACDGRLIHGDLHFGNVLAAAREPWLAIDPHPLSGDPAFEVAPVLWNRFDEVLAADDPRAAILDRFYTMVDVAGLDEDRARAWTIVREVVNIKWGLESGGPQVEDWVGAAVTIVKAVSP